MTEIQREFQAHNPMLCYIDHRYIGNRQIGISFIAIASSNVMGGVRIYNIVDGNIDWKNPVNTVDSWANLKQRIR